MIKQKQLSVLEPTYKLFKKVKVQYQAKVRIELTHDEFELILLKEFIKIEGLRIE